MNYTRGDEKPLNTISYFEWPPPGTRPLLKLLEQVRRLSAARQRETCIMSAAPLVFIIISDIYFHQWRFVSPGGAAGLAVRAYISSIAEYYVQNASSLLLMKNRCCEDEASGASPDE
eukprot:1020629-Prorocentrum_minimum.AAC.2